MKFLRDSFVIVFALVGPLDRPAAAAPPPPTNAPGAIELHDQYNIPQKLSFPTTNVTVLTIADKKGSEQIGDWVAELKNRFAGRITLSGIAEVGGVPGLMQGIVRKKFRKLHSYPVMMDWSGKICAQLRSQKDVANVLVLGRDGVVLGRFSGAADRTNVAAVCVLLDKILSTPSQLDSARNATSP